MKRYLLTMILALISVAICAAWPNAKNIEVRPGSMLGWDNASATWRPVKIDQDTGEIGVAAEVNIGSITVEAFPVFADELGNSATATIDAENRAIVNLGSDSIGLVDAINAVEAELSNAHADPLVAATHTFAILNYLSDGTNFVPWLTAVILGDNVNGNNQAAVAPWIFDGTTWYRRRSVPGTGIAFSVEASPTDWQQQTITLVANTAQTVVSEITGTRKNILLKAQETKPFWVSIDGDAVIGTNGTPVNDWILLDVPLAVNVSVISSEAFDISVTESGW
jgi:hypothetical protein